jgi:aminopeptidase
MFLFVLVLPSLWSGYALAQDPIVKDEPTPQEVAAFFNRTFGVSKRDSNIVVLVDLPSANESLTAAWADRLQLGQEWTSALIKAHPGKKVSLIAYEATGAHNADLPRAAQVLATGAVVELPQVLSESDIVLALTQFSATAPLKAAAKVHGFRGATLPGFSRPMSSSFRLNVNEVARRCRILKKLLSEATSAEIHFEVDSNTSHTLQIDLRHREAHSSDGFILEKGKVANLPGGESYKVPYEGEREGDPSQTNGILPIQQGDEIVLYRVVNNRAVEILSSGEASDRARKLIEADPVAGNIAELGLGVLYSMGVIPIEISSISGDPTLLNEKLGLHIAFARSEHLGGVISPAFFKDPSKAFHQDYIFIDAMQPRVKVRRMDLRFDGTRRSQSIIENNAFVPSLFSPWGRVGDCARALFQSLRLNHFFGRMVKS